MNDLISRSQAGDVHAFAGLFEQYKNLVYRTSLLMLDDPQEAEDALQEVFLKVYRSLHTYCSEKAAFTTWLHQVTVNHCLNHKRKRFLGLIPLGNVPQISLATKSRSVEERVAEDADLRQALSGLSDKLRVVVILRFYSDLSYAEIAQVLEVPIGTVQSRLNQAIQKLRTLLSENGAAGLVDVEFSQDKE